MREFDEIKRLCEEIISNQQNLPAKEVQLAEKCLALVKQLERQRTKRLLIRLGLLIERLLKYFFGDDDA